ncbi:hypothetical protein AOL_s00076g410 [Orbilia oligospora ATCC 24927]|uniref:Acetate kinase n=1 Tax=Arthrobotrys oligospora (strain ATCC 24927 / CBS 115.81 / DSM 1491) TaxID=756982 RepID=G1X9S1_ARTOA|nr:hypothetical protein AOL_s00076g410 [Orbilia oligospora ATCC 24927]EGX50059.1 hypothetical protein AOL_s00076g410 [Orbilia oligospora ATCC 24927]
MTDKRKPDYILAVNAGSSSLKLQLFKITPNHDALIPRLLIKSSLSNLSSPPAKFNFKNYDKEGNDIESQDLHDITSGLEAFEFFISRLKKGRSSIDNGLVDKITHICHRVVHGGEIGERGPLVVNDSVLKQLEEVISLAPLHNGPADQILKAALRSFPQARNIAFFDSSFHNSLPDFIKAYPIDQKIAKERKLRKYGFHGLSYHWIVKNVARFLKKGFKALTGTSDFSEILATDPATPESELAISLFLDRILGFFGSYWLKLGGGRGCVDAVVFAGGIGESSPIFREMIVKGLDGLNGGFDGVDPKKNKEEDGRKVVYSIGDEIGRTRLLVCKTNEELEMVDECLKDKGLW